MTLGSSLGNIVKLARTGGIHVPGQAGADA